MKIDERIKKHKEKNKKSETQGYRLRLDSELYSKLKAEAKKQDLSINSLIEICVEDGLEKLNSK